jgi:hypothetical protein
MSDLQLSLKDYVAKNFLDKIPGGSSDSSVISPVPSSSQLTKGSIYDANLDASHVANPAPVATYPATLQFNPSVANAPLPGQQDWVSMMIQKNPTYNQAYLNNLYQKAVTSQGGHTYNPSAPSPTPAFGQIQNTNPIQNVMNTVGSALGFKPNSSQWNDLVSAATEASKSTGIPLAVMLGQAFQETSGNPNNAPGNNWFGMKGTGSAGSQNLATQEDYGKGLVNINDNFAGYNTAADSVNSYVNWIKSHPEVYALRNNPAAMLQAVKNAGYATSKTYVPDVMSNPIYKQYVNQPIPQKTAVQPVVQKQVAKAPVKTSQAPNQNLVGNLLAMMGIK